MAVLIRCREESELLHDLFTRSSDSNAKSELRVHRRDYTNQPWRQRKQDPSAVLRSIAGDEPITVPVIGCQRGYLKTVQAISIGIKAGHAPCITVVAGTDISYTETDMIVCRHDRLLDGHGDSLLHSCLDNGGPAFLQQCNLPSTYDKYDIPNRCSVVGRRRACHRSDGKYSS